MKFTNVALLVLVSVFLVGCGAKNVPTTNDLTDTKTPNEEAVVVDADADADVDVDVAVDADGKKTILDTLKERN
jgi:type IV pilus biogenesis protein CpaD/CtpE